MHVRKGSFSFKQFQTFSIMIPDIVLIYLILRFFPNFSQNYILAEAECFYV